MIKLSAIQLTSTTSVEANLAKIEALLAELTLSSQNESLENTPIEHIVVLPECCLLFGGEDSAQLTLAKSSVLAPSENASSITTSTLIKNKLSSALGQLAKKFNVYLIAGTVPVLAESGKKFTNTSYAFNPKGEIISRYDKIHLFDVNVSDNTNNYCESRYTEAGKKIKVVNTPFANIGLTVCFDLRFPALFQQLSQRGADIITVPSAFTKVTGKAHWQTLLQARAIENQVYIIAAGQEGVHDNGRETWGHSMIINPWGEIEQCITTGEGFVSVDYKSESVMRIRKNMPLISPLAPV